MRATIRWLNFILLSAAMAALIAAIFLQVFFRYALNSPLAWPEEAGRYLFIWIVFLGIPEAYRDGKHLGMDLFVSRLPHVLRVILARTVEVVILVIAVVTTWFSIDLVELTMRQTAPVLKIPIGFIYLSFTIGFALVAIETLAGWAFRGTRSPGQQLYRIEPGGMPVSRPDGTSGT